MYTPRSALKKALRGQKYRDVVDAREGNGWSALMFALRTGYEMVVDALLERGASTKNVTNDGKTTLMIAAANGNARLVKRMLKRKGNINFLDKSGWTALRYAVSNNRRDITKILIDEGADPDVPDNDYARKNALEKELAQDLRKYWCEEQSLSDASTLDVGLEALRSHVTFQVCQVLTQLLMGLRVEGNPHMADNAGHWTKLDV